VDGIEFDEAARGFWGWPWGGIMSPFPRTRIYESLAYQGTFHARQTHEISVSSEEHLQHLRATLIFSSVLNNLEHELFTQLIGMMMRTGGCGGDDHPPVRRSPLYPPYNGALVKPKVPGCFPCAVSCADVPDGIPADAGKLRMS